MSRTQFPPGVSERLGWYVYRLIDPRNGETFYVGKGIGDRIFEHARGVRVDGDEREGDGDLKLRRIRAILAQGMEVLHVVHHHGIESEEFAYRIETAVMDCFPGLSNLAAGHGASEFGVRHVEQIVDQYAAPELVPLEPLIAISIGRSSAERSIYDAVRGVWRIELKRAVQHKLVLAVSGGLVRGVFRPQQWRPGLREHFSFLDEDAANRFGFVGTVAEESAQAHYLNKRMPEGKGHRQNPIRFLSP